MPPTSWMPPTLWVPPTLWGFTTPWGFTEQADRSYVPGTRLRGRALPHRVDDYLTQLTGGRKRKPVDEAERELPISSSDLPSAR